MAEFCLNLGSSKFVTIKIELSKDLPVTIYPNTPKEEVFPSLLELIHSDDIPPITEMFTEISRNQKTFEAHCRFPVGGDYHWFFLSCSPVYSEYGKPVGFEGTMADVSNYLESAGEDLVYKEFKKKHSLSLKELQANQVKITDILDVDYLKQIQKPFAHIKGLYTGIYSSDDELICSPKHKFLKRNSDRFKIVRKKRIRINHIPVAYWLISSNDQSIIDDNAQLMDTMTLTLSKIANAFVVVSNEMENAQNANKLLGQNVEEQILLNNIYAIIMDSENSADALTDIVNLVGEYMEIDRIIIANQDDIMDNQSTFCWKNKKIGQLSPKTVLKEIEEKHFPELIDELSFNNTYFSTDKDDAKLEGAKSFAISQLIKNGDADSIIVYECIIKQRNWSHRDRKQLRNVSQIISSIIMRINTEKKLDESKSKLKQLAFNDSILNIPNRTKLNKDLSLKLNKNQPGALIAFKVANMRQLSAIYGHSYADLLLRSIAQYLNSIPVKEKSVYYYTNSIFMISLHNSSGTDAKQLAEMLIYRFNRPWLYNNSEHNVACSIGIAFYPVNGSTCEEICKAASLAMYRAREFKKNSYTFYARGLEKSHSSILNIEEHIKRDIMNEMNSFSIKYQPVFSIETGEMCSCESLLRWTNESVGALPNSTILPIIENLGMSHVVDKWVIQQACQFCRELQSKGHPNFQVSVNLSLNELQNRDIVKNIEKVLKSSGISAGSLILELPEKTQNTTYSDTASVMAELHGLGVKICIDDFGAEKICLSSIKNSCIDFINLEKSFVTNCEDEFDRDLVTAITKLAHSKNITICVKGIEDYKQLSKVQDYDVDRIQGYFCSKPMSKDDLLLSSMQKV